MTYYTEEEQKKEYEETGKFRLPLSVALDAYAVKRELLLELMEKSRKWDKVARARLKLRDLIEHARELIKDVEVDLDQPLKPEDE